jgi:hypothetical protein
MLKTKDPQIPYSPDIELIYITLQNFIQGHLFISVYIISH